MPVTSIGVRLAGENSFNAPALSVTSKRPPGRKVIAHGSLKSPKPLDAKGGPSTRVIRGLLTSAALLSALASCTLLHPLRASESVRARAYRCIKAALRERQVGRRGGKEVDGK